MHTSIASIYIRLYKYAQHKSRTANLLDNPTCYIILHWTAYKKGCCSLLIFLDQGFSLFPPRLYCKLPLSVLVLKHPTFTPVFTPEHVPPSGADSSFFDAVSQCTHVVPWRSLLKDLDKEQITRGQKKTHLHQATASSLVFFPCNHPQLLGGEKQEEKNTIHDMKRTH